MTPFERTHPKQINGSRRARIARGSGVTVSEVNQLLERFTDAQKMMRSMRRGGGPGIPGMPAIPGMGGGARKGKQQQRKKGKSGNPAKRAAEEKAALERAAGARTAAANAAFGAGLGARRRRPQGAPDGGDALDPAGLELPKGFEKFLGR